MFYCNCEIYWKILFIISSMKIKLFSVEYWLMLKRTSWLFGTIPFTIYGTSFGLLIFFFPLILQLSWVQDTDITYPVKMNTDLHLISQCYSELQSLAEKFDSLLRSVINIQ